MQGETQFDPEIHKEVEGHGKIPSGFVDETAEEDIEIAHAMANTGKLDRDGAAKLRKMANESGIMDRISGEKRALKKEAVSEDRRAEELEGNIKNKIILERERKKTRKSFLGAMKTQDEFRVPCRRNVVPKYNGIQFINEEKSRETGTSFGETIVMRDAFEALGIPLEKLADVYDIKIIDGEPMFTGQFKEGGKQALANIIGKRLVFLHQQGFGHRPDLDPTDLKETFEPKN